MSTDTVHPNIHRLNEMMAAFNRGDLDGYFSHWAEEPIVHSGGSNVLAGTYRGRDQVVGLYRRMFELTGGTASVEVEDVLADDQHGSVITRAMAHREGRDPLDLTLAIAYRAGDTGRWAQAWYLADDQKAWDEFFS